MKKNLVTLSLLGFSTVTLASSLNLFSQPNANSTILGQAPEQDISLVNPLQIQGDWVKVKDQKNQDVWVSITPKLSQEIAQERAKIRNQYIQDQLQRFDQVKTQMMQQYNLMSNQMQQQWEALQAQFENDANSTVQNTKNNEVKRQFSSINIQYDGNGKNATVTKEWLDSNGKIQKETKTVPVDQLHELNFSESSDINQ